MTARSAKPAKRERLRPEVRREQLLDVAEQLFVERGYVYVTVGEIAQAAGVTRSLANYHFGSKEGVYVACLERAMAGFSESLADTVQEVAEPRERLRAGIDAFFKMIEDNPRRWSLLFGDSVVLEEEYAARVNAAHDQAIHAILALLQPLIPKAAPQRARAAAYATSGAASRVGLWLIQDAALTREEAAEHVTAILWDGLRVYR